jgi:anti-anti-sigma factor
MFDSQHIKAEADKGVLVVAIKSEKISEYEATIIQNEIANLAKGLGWKIALDLSAVGMVASVGLGMLVSLNRTAKTNKGKLALCQLASPIREVLKMTRLDSGLTIVPDRAAAIAACA